MHRLTTFQIILLAVFGALAISGVLVFSFVASGSLNTSLGPVTVWGTLDHEAFQSVLEKVATTDHRFDQVNYEQKSEATYESDITNAIVNGTAPELFLLRQDLAYRNRSKSVPIPSAQLSDSQFQNTFVASANPFIVPGVGIMGAPILADPLVLFWNRDMFASAGLASPPAYWDELSNATQKITKRDDTGSILQSAIAFGEYRNVRYAKEILSTLIMQVGGSITGYDSNGQLASLLSRGESANTQATESALRFYTEFADPSKADYSWNRSLPDSRAAFAAGSVAMYIGYASEVPLITRTNPNLNFAVAPLPQIRRSGGDKSPDVGNARVYALVAAKAPNWQKAQLVASLLSVADTSSALAKELGVSSPRRDVLQAMLASGSQIQSALNAAPGTEAVIARGVNISRTWIDPDPEKTDLIFRDMIEGIVSGALRSNDAISRADQAVNALIKPNI